MRKKLYFDNYYERECRICNVKFRTPYKKQVVCSFECRMEANKRRTIERYWKLKEKYAKE